MMRALSVGLILLAGVSHSAGQVVPPAGKSATGRAAPDSSQGTVDASGKFVSTKPTVGLPKTPATSGEWRRAASRLIEETGEHTFRIGVVLCDRTAGTLTIPAHVNAREGLIEYALVTRQGKIHEALLSTNADPLHVQVAALLLGMSPQPGNHPCEVSIEVEWATNGPIIKVPLEEMIVMSREAPQSGAGTTMTRGPWKLTGSRIDTNGFAAAREGSIIALIGDPAAIIVNPRPGSKDDSLHLPHTSAMPAVNMPVSVRITRKPLRTQDGKPQTGP